MCVSIHQFALNCASLFLTLHCFCHIIISPIIENRNCVKLHSNFRPYRAYVPWEQLGLLPFRRKYFNEEATKNGNAAAYSFFACDQLDRCSNLYSLSFYFRHEPIQCDEFNDPSSSLVAFLLSSKAGGWWVNNPFSHNFRIFCSF